MKAELAKELSAILDQPSAEMMLLPMAVGGTTSVPGEVVVVTKEYAIIVTDDHRRVVLNSTDVDYRFVVGDMAKKFPVGSRVSGAFEVDFTGASKYTLTAGTANPWPGLQSQFPAGQQFVGKVDRVIGGTGAFVHVAHGVNGLIPEYKLAGRQVLAGDDVEVAVASIDVDRRRINLRLDRVLTEHRQQPRKMTEAAIEADKRQWPTAGEKLYGAVVKAVPVVNHKGGYILLETEESNPCTLMLHCSKMLPDLREDLNNGEVKVDDLIYVEIEKVDRVHNKVSVRELLEPDEGFGASAAA